MTSGTNRRQPGRAASQGGPAMARIDPTPPPDGFEQSRLPAQPSNRRPRRPAIPRSWAGLIVAFLLGALVSGLITGAVVYSLNDDPRVVTRTVTAPASDPAGPVAAAAPCAETARL